MSRWREVTKRNPCPCGKTHYCAWTPDGELLRCMGAGGELPDMRCIGPDKSGGTLYAFDDRRNGNGQSYSHKPARAAAKPAEPAARDWKAEAERFQAAMTPERMQALADATGVPATAWAMLSPGWATREELRAMKASGAGWAENYPDGAYTFPERDGRGRVVGLALRASDGRKGAPAGGKRGLIVPMDFHKRTGPALTAEGASDTATLTALGLRAVGRPSNRSGGEDLADLLDGLDLVVVGENDGKPEGSWPGRDGAKAVATQLAARWKTEVAWALPPADVKDARAWLLSRVQAGLNVNDADAMKVAGAELLAALKTAAKPVKSDVSNDAMPAGAIGSGSCVNCQRVGSVPTYLPFPLDALPAVVARFISEASTAIGCDPAYIALPLLAVLASAIGNTRRIRLKSSWTEVAVLWCLIVGDSGTLKSPAFDLAISALRRWQARAMIEYRKALAAYCDEKEQFDAELRTWRKADAGKRGERPSEPDAPVCARMICSDATVEALAMLLAAAWRGLLLARDEFAGWLASFDQYKAGQGGDVAHWLEMHRAGVMVVDRKTGEKTTIHVPRAAVCIAGGIQPETLRRALTPEFFDNGLAARLLLSMPPKRSKQWTEADVDGHTLDAVDKLFSELLNFQPSTDIDGEPEPADVTLTDEAKAVWVEFYNRHAQEQSELAGNLSAAWSKLEGYAARLALVVHCIRQASGEAVDPWRLDEQSMAAGIVLADWFGHEAKRVYAVLGESREDRSDRQLIDLIRCKGGSATVRDLSRSSRLYDKAAAWNAALQELADAGIGRWQYPKPGNAGGHPAKVFHLLNQQNNGTAVATLTVDGTTPGDGMDASTVTADEQIERDERAAILEFDAGMSRSDAERIAHAEKGGGR